MFICESARTLDLSRLVYRDSSVVQCPYRHVS